MESTNVEITENPALNKADVSSRFMEMLNTIAERWAKKFGYELEEDKILDPETEFHPLNRVNNKPLRSVKYKGAERGSYVDTRQRFGSPRIGISAPNQEWFVGLEFKNEKVSECQIFYEKGFDMMPIIRAEIENEWRSLNGC
jgi:hypothetical protein